MMENDNDSMFVQILYDATKYDVFSSMMLGRSCGVVRWVCDDKSLTFGSFKAAAQGFM